MLILLLTPHSSKVSVREDALRHVSGSPDEEVCAVVGPVVGRRGGSEPSRRGAQRPEATSLRHHQRPGGGSPHQEEIQEQHTVDVCRTG